MKIIIVSEIGKSFFTKYIIEDFDDVKIKSNIDGEEIYTLPDGSIPDNPDAWQSMPDPIITEGFVVMKSERPSVNHISNQDGEWVYDKSLLISKNNLIKDDLLSESNQKISILEDAIDLDMAEKGDADKLKNWRKYRILLSRVDASIENMELPKKPD